MSAIVRLEWEIDSKGYDIEDRPDPTPSRSVISTNMTKAEATMAGDSASGLFLVPRGGRPERYVLEGIKERIFEDLIATPQTPEGALAFAKKRGLLYRTKDMSLCFRDDRHDGFVNGEFYNCIGQLRHAVKLAHEGRLDALERAMQRGGIKGLQVRFGRMRGDTAPRVFVEPSSLNHFCWLELMQLIAGGTQIQKCLNCGAFFSIGIEKGTRITRQYCSDRCRVAMHRKNKRCS